MFRGSFGGALNGAGRPGNKGRPAGRQRRAGDQIRVCQKMRCNMQDGIYNIYIYHIFMRYNYEVELIATIIMRYNYVQLKTS